MEINFFNCNSLLKEKFEKPKNKIIIRGLNFQLFCSFFLHIFFFSILNVRAYVYKCVNVSLFECLLPQSVDKIVFLFVFFFALAQKTNIFYPPTPFHDYFQQSST